MAFDHSGKKSTVCPVCKGKKTTIIRIKGGETKEVTCPRCRGSGTSGLLTK